MFMPFVPTMMATMEGGMFEEVMTKVTVANKIFNIQNNQQSSKDIFMNEDDEEEEEVSSFDSLSLLNNNEPSPMTTRPLWWFTKDVLRRTTEGTQLEEDYDVDEECRGRTEKHK